VTRIDPHVNYSSDWGTPPEWVEWVRATMGGIDLDPCGPDDGSNPIGARRVYAPPGLDGLREPWRGRVYCNPPGANSIDSVKPWWSWAMSRRLSALTWCFFNAEAVKSVRPTPLDLHGYLVIPLKRVAFMRNGKRQKSPRNWAWFWTTREPAPAPVECRIIPTGQRTAGVLVSGVRP